MDGDVKFIDRPVEPKLRHGVVFFDIHTGDSVLHFATSIPTFIHSFSNAGLVAHQWRASQCSEVVELSQFRA